MKTTTRKIGFAALSPERRAEIAAMGGRAAHATGRAHRFTKEEAARAGALGGAVMAQRDGHMSRIGRLGGGSRKGKRRARS